MFPLDKNNRQSENRNMKIRTVRGNNITFATKNRTHTKNMKKHSELLLKEMQIKYSFNEL